MSMTENMARVERMALRGLTTEQILRRGVGLPERTVSAIVGRAMTNAVESEVQARLKAIREMRALEAAAAEASQAGWDHSEADGPMSLTKVLTLCAARAGVGVDDFLAPVVHGPLVEARQEAMYLAMTLTSAETPKIADAFERDQKTIRHGACVHAARIGLEPPRGLKPAPRPKRESQRHPGICQAHSACPRASVA